MDNNSFKGLLDFASSPAGQGLLGAAFGGLAAAGRGGPLNTIGRAGMSGLLAFGNAEEAEQRRLQQQMAMQDAEQQRSYRQLQIDEATRKAQDAQKVEGWWTKVPGLLGAPSATSPAAVPMQAANTGAAGGAEPLTTSRPWAGSGGPSANAGNPELLQHLLRPESPFASEVLKRYALPKQAEAFTLSPGQVRYEGGQAVASLPEQQKRTSVEELLDAAGIKDPQLRQRYTLQALQKQTTHAPAASQTIIQKQESAEAQKVGGFFGEAYSQIQQAGFNSQAKLNRYNRLGELLEGVETGKFAETGVEVAKAARTLGLNVDPSLANKEAALALSSEIALELRNPSGGAGMPGAMSDKDREFLAGMVPGIDKTPEGRRLMLTTARKLAQRDADVARMARDYRKKNGSLDEGFYDALAAWSGQNPLFPQQAAAPAAGGGFSIRRVK